MAGRGLSVLRVSYYDIFHGGTWTADDNGIDSYDPESVLDCRFCGWNHANEVIRLYTEKHGEPPDWRGIHLHIYGGDGRPYFPLDNFGMFARWRALADRYGWELWVTELGIIANADTIVELMPVQMDRMMNGVRDSVVLRPDAVFWFSEYWPHEPFASGNIRHTPGGALTEVGEKWIEMSNGNQ